MSSVTRGVAAQPTNPGDRSVAAIELREAVDQPRRRLLGGAALTLAAAEFALAGAARAQAHPMRHAQAAPVARACASIGPIKQVTAGLLIVGYAEFGPPDGPPVVLLHGWPYDVYSFAEVTPILAAAGYRVVCPFLRGYGPTAFR